MISRPRSGAVTRIEAADALFHREAPGSVLRVEKSLSNHPVVIDPFRFKFGHGFVGVELSDGFQLIFVHPAAPWLRCQYEDKSIPDDQVGLAVARKLDENNGLFHGMKTRRGLLQFLQIQARVGTLRTNGTPPRRAMGPAAGANLKVGARQGPSRHGDLRSRN